MDFIRLDGAFLNHLAVDPDAVLRAGPWLNADIARDFLQPVAKAMQTLYAGTGARFPWIGYLACREEDLALVGSCVFKAPPEEGTVEIAFYTFPPYEGQGVATAMTADLVALARAEPDIMQIIAHTLPEENVSTRILRHQGFDWEDEVDHPEDGTVWRWSLTL